MRTSVRANVTSRLHDDEVARRHQPDAAGARPAPSTAAIVGAAASISRFSARTIGAESGGPVRALLEVGAGAERRRRVGQHDDADRAVGDCRLGDVERRVEVADELAWTARCGWPASRA